MLGLRSGPWHFSPTLLRSGIVREQETKMPMLCLVCKYLSCFKVHFSFVHVSLFSFYLFLYRHSRLCPNLPGRSVRGREIWHSSSAWYNFSPTGTHLGSKPARLRTGNKSAGSDPVALSLVVLRSSSLFVVVTLPWMIK